jgi:hypothetical protein
MKEKNEERKDECVCDRRDNASSCVLIGLLSPCLAVCTFSCSLSRVFYVEALCGKDAYLEEFKSVTGALEAQGIRIQTPSDYWDDDLWDDGDVDSRLTASSSSSSSSISRRRGPGGGGRGSKGVMMCPKPSQFTPVPYDGDAKSGAAKVAKVAKGKPVAIRPAAPSTYGGNTL